VRHQSHRGVIIGKQLPPFWYSAERKRMSTKVSLNRASWADSPISSDPPIIA